MSLYREPPESIVVEGHEYPVDTDFRTWIGFQGILTSRERDEEKAAQVYALMERLGLPASEASLEAMVSFFEGASAKQAGAGESGPSAFDFERDSAYIYSAFLAAYEIDLTTARLHWWKFKALFQALPDDCEICKIMRYRTVDLKDVPKSQKQFYRQMKARYALPGVAGQTHRTDEDMRGYVQRRFEDARKRQALGNLL